MSSVNPAFTKVPSFAGLPAPSPRRWRCFAGAVVLQSILVALLVHYGVIQPAKLIPAKMEFIALQALPPVNHAPQRIPPRLLRAPKLKVEPPQVAKLEPPKIETPPLPKPKVPEIKPEPTKPEVAAVKPKPEVKPEVKTGSFQSAATNDRPAPRPVPQVHTGAFGSGSSATPTAVMSAKQVQTGGFGDPNGVPADPNNKSGRATIAKVGSFDLPSGPGYGNGTGGAVGARAVVASAGFGDGIAQGGGGTGHVGGTVKESGFGDSAPVKEVAVNAPAPRQPATLPVEIEYKPKPSYTSEARQLHLEGEVLLEVTFGADGRVSVRRVVRGLGHGLDEQAVKAAQQIRFKPATRAGSPVDAVAVLHIVFQLA